MQLQGTQNIPIPNLDSGVNESYLHISRSHTPEAIEELLAKIAPHMRTMMDDLPQGPAAKTIAEDFLRAVQIRRLSEGYQAKFTGSTAKEPHMITGISVHSGMLTIDRPGEKQTVIGPGETVSFSDLTHVNVRADKTTELLQIVSPPAYYGSTLWLPEQTTQAPQHIQRRLERQRTRWRKTLASLSDRADSLNATIASGWSKITKKYRHAGEPLRIAFVHAHPDDESSKGAATMARYVEQGAEVHVITCTGGEEGSILNPTLPSMSGTELQNVRVEEMENATRILGIHHHWLGYRDSGMPENDTYHPNSLVAQEENAKRKLLTLVREIRPHVMVIYDETGGYPHPDHIAVHNIGKFAFHEATNIEKYPEDGPPWSASTLFYHKPMHKKLIELAHHHLQRAGRPSPFLKYLEQNPHDESHATTRIRIRSRHVRTGDRALAAHTTQVDPQSPFLIIPARERARLGERYTRAFPPITPGTTDTDLFSGIKKTLKATKARPTEHPPKPTKSSAAQPSQRLRSTR